MRWIVLPLLAPLLACDPFNAEFEPREPAEMYRARVLAPAAEAPVALRIMTWNVKFAGARLRFFWECDGERGWMTEREVEAGLLGLAEKINQYSPDVLLLQEIDTRARRTAYVDQVQWLLDHTALNYGAYASSWRADYVPSDGVGRMDSGNAILSRWPIERAERVALDLISDQSAITNYFYLKRNVLIAQVPLGVTELAVLNVHTEAFSRDGTKKRHIDSFLQEMNAQRAAGRVVVGGGDLNAIPPGSPRRAEFPDDCDDARFEGDNYQGEERWLDALYAEYDAAIPLAAFQGDPERYMTFTGDADVFWSRKLDYLFTNEVFRPDAGIVHQNDARGGMATLERSDHAPLSATLELP